jgi:hypothetical protein
VGARPRFTPAMIGEQKGQLEWLERDPHRNVLVILIVLKIG